MTNFEPGFNLRVYGLLIQDVKDLGPSILMSHELYDGPELIKFPGGGIEHLEAPGAALIREFKEEVDVDVQLGEFSWVSPNFHKSYFRAMQLIALYWQVKALGPVQLPGIPVPIAEGHIRHQLLFWQPLSGLKLDMFSNDNDVEVTQRILHLAAKGPFW